MHLPISPTLCLSVFNPIAQVVPRMINVLKRSRAESTRDAVSDIDEEYTTATPFAATSRILITVFTGSSSV